MCTCRIRKLLRVILIAAVAVTALCAVRSVHAKTIRTFDPARFESAAREIDVMYRKLHGCPASGYPPVITCTEAEGVFDVKQWDRVVTRTEALVGASH